MKNVFSTIARRFELWHRRDGIAAVEFALLAPVFLITLLGTIEIGRLMWTQNALNYAVQEASRCMTLKTCGAGGPAGYAAAVSTNFTTSNFTATTVACGNQVSASYPFIFLTSLVNLNGMLNQVGIPNGVTLTASSCFPT